MSDQRRRERVAMNFVRRYGHTRFKELIEALERGDSGQVIAESFDVSRERVRQWKNVFGHIMTLYQVYPEVQWILDDPESV